MSTRQYVKFEIDHLKGIPTCNIYQTLKIFSKMYVVSTYLDIPLLLPPPLYHQICRNALYSTVHTRFNFEPKKLGE